MFNESDMINLYILRFISEIEAICRQWLADGSKNLLVCLLLCQGFNLYFTLMSECVMHSGVLF